MLAHEASGGQVEDEGLVDGRIERPVEVLEVLNDWDVRLPKSAGEKPISTPGQFILDQQFQEVRQGKLVMDGFPVTGRVQHMGLTVRWMLRKSPERYALNGFDFVDCLVVGGYHRYDVQIADSPFNAETLGIQSISQSLADEGITGIADADMGIERDVKAQFRGEYSGV
jgi:hypothetical protein